MKTVTRTIRNLTERQQFIKWLEQVPEAELTITVRPGIKRSLAQNRLFWQWMQDLESQGDMTASEYRAYCKAYFGVKILRAEDEAFRAQYDQHVRPLPYESKLAIMVEPIDFPVTRLMTVKQEKAFLDAIWNHFTGVGFRLTDPGIMGLEQCGS